MKSHSKRILSLVFALLMAFQQVMFAAQTVDLLTPAEQTQTVDLLTGEEENKTVDLLTPAESSAPIEQPIEQSKPIIEENKVNENQNENQTVDLLTPGDDEVVPEEGKKSTTTILIGGEEEEETQDDSWDLTPAEITVPEENHDEEEKKDATFEDEKHHENAGALPWSTDLVKPWSIYREPKKVYRPGEDLDLTELLVEIKTGRSGSLYNIEDLINDEFTTITRTRKSDGEKVRLDDKIYEDETMTIHMDGCQDLTIDFIVDENLKDEEEALEAFQDNLIREEFRDGLDFSLYLIKKGERVNPIVAYSLDPHKLTPIGNGVDKKLKDGPLFDLKDINTWDRFDIETLGKVKAILERSAEIKNTENVRKKLITQLAIWNVTSNIIPREIDATVSEIEETETTDFGPELKPTDEEEIPEEKEEEPIEIIDPTTPEEEIESVEQDEEVETVEEKTEIEKTEAEEKAEIEEKTETEEPAEEKTEAEEPVEENTQENKESEKIEELAPVQSTVHKIVFDVREIDVPYNEVELSDEEYALYNELTSLKAIELKSEDEDLKIYEPTIEETENPYADLVTIGESDIDSIERVETEVTFDAVDYSFQNLYHTLETSSMLGFGQPRDFNVLLKATMKASRKIVEGDKFEVEILSKTLPILNGEEGRANDIQIDGKVVATAEYIAEEHKIVYTFVEDLDTDKVEIEQEFKQIKEEKAALLNMLDVSENLILDAVRGAEGDEDSEENPDELEISPEDDNVTIRLVLGNTPVKYNGVSFETKKFRLKTTMTAKAYPIWQIPVGWTFDVKIGDYLKPDPNYPLKPLYDPDNPSVVIAKPKYNEATHTITYTYEKSISSTKTLDIDQYLAFDTDNIGTKDKIDINISVEPKNNPKQQMPTKTVYRDDRSPVITSAFEVEFDENGEPNLNNQYKFFEYGPSYKVTFDASANPIIENREVKAVEWTVVFDGNGENLNSKQLDLITNFTAVRNSGLEKIEEDVTLNGQAITLTANDMGDKFLINDSKYFDGHNNLESVYTFKFKTPVDSKQKAYVIDIAAKLRGVKKTGAVRLIMPAYEGARLEMVSPNDMTHSNRTTISGKFTAEDKAEWIVTEEVSTGDQGSLPLIERNISENQNLDYLNVAYYGLDKDGKMAQFKKETPRKEDNPIKAGNLDGYTTFAPGTIAVYEYKTSLLNSDKPETYTLSNGAISKYRDVNVNITWSKRVENSKYPEETLILSEKDNEKNSSSIKIDKENDPPQSTSVVITKVPNVKIWNIGQNGEPQKIEYKIKQELPTEGYSNGGKKVKYGEVYKRYEPVTGIYEIQNYIVEDKGSTPANITIKKTDEGGKPLSGAKFKLFGIQNTEEQNKSETFTIEGISGLDGSIEFNNIPSGIYTLKEERAPEGYAPLSKNETITVNDDGSVEWTNNIITDASFETGSASTGWKSDPKYYNGSFSWAGYMNSIDYTEVDKNNNFTSYIMLKPDVNSFRPGSKELTYTDRCTRVSMFGQNLDITDAQIFDVYPSEREQVKNAMYSKTAGKLSLGNDLSNIGNNSGMIVKESNFYDDVVGQNVYTIKIPYKRFGEPDPKEPENFEGWAFLIKVTGKINNTKSDSSFSYKWLTTSAPKVNDLNSLLSLNERKIQTKIESDTTIPVAENRNSALNPTFTIVNESAKLTKLNIQKQDDKGNELSGAEFRLYNSDNELINSGVTTSTGKITFEGLAPGEYTLKETKSPEGYHNPELTFKLLVSQDGSILYSATDKEGNSVPEGDYYRVGESSSVDPSFPTGDTEIIVQKAIMYLDESQHYGKTPGVWEEAAYESYSFEGNFHIENAVAGESWIMDFDDNWNFTQWAGKLPEIKLNTGELIATGEIDYTNNQIKYTLADTQYVKDHSVLDCGIKLNSIRPSKYYVKNNGIYAFRDVINVGANQKVVDTTVNADLFQFYGERGDNQYITQNVDIYKDKNENRYFMRNIALFNVKGVKNFNGEKIARIYYGSSINNGKEILYGDKQEPTYKPVKVIVYKVDHPNSDNMPLSCGIRPSSRSDIYTKIAEYNDFSKNFVDSRQGRVTMNFDPGRVNINNNYEPDIYSNGAVQFLITLPDKINGYVIEQFYEITDVKRFENTYTQTFMFHSGGSKTGGWEQIKPTLNSGAGIGGDYTPPKPKNYDLTVFNKKQPGEFIVKKVSEKDSQGNVKVLAGAEFTLFDENNKVVRRNSSNIQGIVEFKGLSEGTYTLKETVPPEGYKATDRIITVKIDKDGKITFEGLKQDDDIFNILNNSENPTIQVTNKPNKTKVTITKVDEEDNTTLPGAVFGLFKEDGKTAIQKKNGNPYTVTTGEDGKATFEDLEPGTYVIKEIKAPNGYELTNKNWKVDVWDKNKITVTERTERNIEKEFAVISKNQPSIISFAGKKLLKVHPTISINTDGTYTAKLNLNRLDTENSGQIDIFVDNKNFVFYDNTIREKDGWKLIYLSKANVDKTFEFKFSPKASLTEEIYFPITRISYKGVMLDGSYLPKLSKLTNDKTSTNQDVEKYSIVHSNSFYRLWNNDRDKIDLVTVKTDISKINDSDSYNLDIIMDRKYNGDLKLYNEVIFNTSLFDVYTEARGYEPDENGKATFWINCNKVYSQDSIVRYKITPKKGIDSDKLQPIKSLKFGNAVIQEVDSNGKYLAYLSTLDEKEINDVVQSGNEFSFNATNRFKGFNVKFEKYESLNNQTIKIADAEFKLQVLDGKDYRDFTNEEKQLVNDISKSDTNGIVEFKGLRPGKYRLIETKAPDVYKIPSDPVKYFEITKDGKTIIYQIDENKNLVEDTTNTNHMIENDRVGKGKFELIKFDPNEPAEPNSPHYNSKKILKGVGFELIKSNGKRYGDIMYTDKEGKISFENLPFDRYTLREVSTLPGYIVDKEERIILIGEQWDVPKDENGKDVKGSDVSRLLQLNKPESKIAPSNGTDSVKPNKGDLVSVNLKYKILSEDGIKPGDTFKLVTNKNVDFDSISRVPDYKYDIYGPAGRVAVAKIGKDRKSITYTFTEYLESSTLKELNIGMLLAVDRFNVKNSGNIDVSIDFENSIDDENKINSTINVDYTYFEKSDLNGCLVKYIDGSLENPKQRDTFKIIYYIKNHKFKDVDSYGKNLEIYSDDIDFYIDEVKAYKVERGHDPVPWSFGLNLTARQNDTEYGLKWVGDYFYEYPQNSGKYIINLNPDDLDKSEYVVEVKGTVKNLNDKPFTLKCQYNRVYRQFDENNYYYDTPMYEVATVFKRKEETSSSATTTFTLTVPNHKNKIEYTKVDGSIAGTAVDKKSQGAAEGSNEMMAVQRPVFSSEGKALAGVEFRLQKKNASGEFKNYGDSIKSDSNGKFSWEGLPEGEYQVVEIGTLPGYSEPKNPVSTFKVNAKGEIVDIKDNTTIIINEKIKPNIEFNKIDGRDKTPLKDAEFTLYKAKVENGSPVIDGDSLKFEVVNREVEESGQKVDKEYTAISDENGLFKFEKLEDGIYAVKETKEPDEYIKFKNYVFYFKVEGTKIYRVNKLGDYIDKSKEKEEVVKDENKDADSLIVNMENDTAQAELIQIKNFKAEYPSTGGVGALPFVFIGMMIMMVGAYMFIRRRDALYE